MRKPAAPLVRLQLMAMLAAVLGFGCKGAGLESAPYKAPEVGVRYKYSGGLTNTITAVNGWRTEFVDDKGRPGSRLGLFVNEDPASPVTVDSGDLERLWPIELNKETKVTVHHGPEVYTWQFRVVSEEKVFLGNQAISCYVVQAVQDPVLVKDPRKTTSTINTWWYSPALNAVVKFKTTYVGGPTAGKAFTALLERIDPAGLDAQKR
jgi:hypothetical protein